jgi:hypothetical protein
MVNKMTNILEASEEQLLSAYLNSRGINAKFVTKDTKIAHAKSAEYAKWKADHYDRFATEEMQIQEADKEDTITFDIPLLIRVLEYAREDAKTDMDLHKVTEKLISIRGKGTLTMADYDFITKLKEEFELDKLSEVYKDPTALDHETVKRHLHNIMGITHDENEPSATPAVHRAIKKVSTAGSSSTKSRSREILRALIQKHHIPIDSEHRALLNKEETKLDEWENTKTKAMKSLHKGSGPKPTALDRFRAAAAERAKKHAAISKNSGGMSAAIDRLEKHLNKEESEQIDELKKSTVFSWLKKQPVVPTKKPGMDRKAHNQRIKTHNKSWNRALDRLSGYKPTSEDTYQDSYAATQTTGSEVVDLPPDEKVNKKQLSKSARIIKSLYKKLNMKEELYDHEKEDKSVATYGKKPTMVKTDKKSMGDNQPQAAAVLSGGKTLTGQTRDTLEIDPLMRKPGPPLDQNKKV